MRILLLAFQLQSCLVWSFLQQSVLVNPLRVSCSNSARSGAASVIVLGAKQTTQTPRFNKATQKWERSVGDDGVYPYDAIGALLRHGPAPFVSRLTNPSGYEQEVLQYMVSTGVSRSEATGNVDAKLSNAADWAFQKMAEKKGAPKVDYTRLDAKNAILVTIWALGITPLTISVIYDTVSQYEGPHRQML